MRVIQTPGLDPIWLQWRDNSRITYLAHKLGISETEVIQHALKYYENSLLTNGDSLLLERLGGLGKLMMPTKEPRGPIGPRGVMGNFDIRKHVTHLDPITDAEGDRWIPVLEEDFKELTKIDILEE